MLTSTGRMRCAYLILAHRFPQQLARLVSALRGDSGEAGPILIHLDRAVALEPFQAALDRRGVTAGWRFVERRVDCAWGDFSLVQATLNSLGELQSLGQPFDYVSLLSGQDYPLMTPRDINATLARAPGAEYLSYFPLPHPAWHQGGGLDRYLRYHHPALSGTLRRGGGRYLAAVIERILARLPKRGLPAPMKLYGGWQWWTLSAECVRFALDYVRGHPEFVRFYRYSLIPDESFFQTLILNSLFAARVVNDNLRFVEWVGVKPRVLEAADLPKVLASGRPYARKFDAESRARVLDELDARLAELGGG